MKPEVYEFQEKKVIGIGNIESPINPGDVWPILFSRIQEIHGRKNSPETLGVIKRNKPGYLAGIEVAQMIEIPEGMFSYVIPAGQYVGMTHKGPLSKIGETFYTLIDWLASNNYDQHDIVCFEVYDERFKGEDPESEFDSYIQII
ncbi:GyrI-like domain-containing protein [Paenibacillus rhizovicinus]|uniref:GyrI-like domain-containing protein n=1 Tax=Paenibacillus rhizovicinus TaxID=2704463 RepID=A0A6C0P9L4_9BACL|nr:GyrI-like domain-containing protein [Paenibacillus rhizovicinus]QHW33222.1 GyrI-like domain-containing protein [Paenibacillus rhizovicinus]